MKKQLLCTSAIALGCAMAAPAAAQEWNVKVGGFYNTHVGISQADSDAAPGADFDGVDVYTNAEIIFRPSITLDNGLTFGAEVQLEAMNQANGEIDESFLSISGDQLGRIDLGSENSAGYKMMVTAPGIGIGINSPSVSGFLPMSTGQGGVLPFNFRSAAISAYTEVAGNNDVQRISYYTPSFNGLTIGLSYAASGALNAANNFAPDRSLLNLEDIFDIGVAYSQSFNGVDLDLSARWGTASTNTAFDDPTTWGIGASIGFNGFTIGGSYTDSDNDGNGAPGINGLFDQEGWALGVSYDIPGPWTVALDTYQGTYDQAGGDIEYEAYQLGARRSLGKGVAWQIYGVYAEGNDKAANLNMDGTVLATSINLSF